MAGWRFIRRCLIGQCFDRQCFIGQCSALEAYDHEPSPRRLAQHNLLRPPCRQSPAIISAPLIRRQDVVNVLRIVPGIVLNAKKFLWLQLVYYDHLCASYKAATRADLVAEDLSFVKLPSRPSVVWCPT